MMNVYHITTTWVPGESFIVFAYTEDQALTMVRDRIKNLVYAASFYVEKVEPHVHYPKVMFNIEHA